MASPLALLPDVFYPLSASMVRHLATERHIQTTPSRVPLEYALSFEDHINYLRAEYVKTWQPLINEVTDLREQAEQAIIPALEKKTLSTNHFLDVLLTSTKKRRDAQEVTLSRWRGRGLLRYDERGKINPSTAIAILMMLLAFKNKQTFLPPGKHINEPYMYVWAKESPSSAPTPCGLPLAALPTHTFLYTPWHLLGQLSNEWLPFGKYGSVRWAGVIQEDEQLLWDLNGEALQLWDSSIAQLHDGRIPESVQRQSRHTLANLILLRQANEHLTHLHS